MDFPKVDQRGTPERSFLVISEEFDAAWSAWSAWSSSSNEFPGSFLMRLNVIKSMGCSRELTGRNWKGNRKSCIVSTYICIHKCKDQSAYFPESTIPRNTLPLLSLQVEPIWFAIDLEDAWLVLRECIPRYDLKPRSLRLTGCVSKFYNLYKYLTRVDNPMTYPADVVIASGAYMVRQRSRRRLARPPWMHTTF